MSLLIWFSVFKNLIPVTDPKREVCARVREPLQFKEFVFKNGADKKWNTILILIVQYDLLFSVVPENNMLQLWIISHKFYSVILKVCKWRKSYHFYCGAVRNFWQKLGFSCFLQQKLLENARRQKWSHWKFQKIKHKFHSTFWF